MGVVEARRDGSASTRPGVQDVLGEKTQGRPWCVETQSKQLSTYHPIFRMFQDFANAVDKMSRAGYKGKHGDFEVPTEKLEELNALYMQATVGDYGRFIKILVGSSFRPSDGNTALKCSQHWKKHSGKTQIEAIREYIKLTNMVLTKYGWNPPEGWVWSGRTALLSPNRLLLWNNFSFSE